MGIVIWQPSPFYDPLFLVWQSFMVLGWALAVAGIATWVGMSRSAKKKAQPTLAWFSRVVVILQSILLTIQLAFLVFSLLVLRMDEWWLIFVIFCLIFFTPSAVSILSWRRINGWCLI